MSSVYIYGVEIRKKNRLISSNKYLLQEALVKIRKTLNNILELVFRRLENIAITRAWLTDDVKVTHQNCRADMKRARSLLES